VHHIISRSARRARGYALSAEPARPARDFFDGRLAMKGQQKPKQLAKKAPQKTLKERRAEKQAKSKRSTSGI
jgi:hypothetical protein